MPQRSDDDYEQRQRRRNMYGYCGRTVITVIGVASIASSLYASTTCDFITYESLDGTSNEQLEPPFDRAVRAKVGIFQYEVLQAEGREPVNEGCGMYDDMFQEMADTYPSLTSAQFCALLAPVAAAFALFLNFFECFLCSFYASFLLTGFLFLTATGVQAGTFSLVADPGFCFNNNQECTQEQGVYFGIAATIGFFLSATLLCCMPRPDPCCFAKLQDDRDEHRRGRTNLSQADKKTDKRPKSKPAPKRSKQPEPTNSKQTKKTNATNKTPSFSDEELGNSRQEQYASSSASDDDDDDRDSDNNPKQPVKRKVSRNSSVGKTPIPRNSMRDSSHHSVSESEFHGAKTPPRNANHVETTEKLFPDGSKQVTETTHFADGSKAVKTRMYGPGEYDDDSFGGDDTDDLD